jgi:hypothetical protein
MNGVQDKYCLVKSSFFQLPAKFCWSSDTTAEVGFLFYKVMYGLLFSLNRRPPVPLFFLFCLPISRNQPKEEKYCYSILHTVYFVLPSVEDDSPKIPEWHLASFQFLTIFPVLFLFRTMEKFMLFGWLVATDCRYDLLNLRSFIN